MGRGRFAAPTPRVHRQPLQPSFALESLRILDEGIATHAQIDGRCAGGGYPHGAVRADGPDRIDVNLEVARSFYGRRAEPRWRPHRDPGGRWWPQGGLGRKSGAGFYEYGEERRPRSRWRPMPPARSSSSWWPSSPTRPVGRRRGRGRAEHRLGDAPGWTTAGPIGVVRGWVPRAWSASSTSSAPPKGDKRYEVGPCWRPRRVEPAVTTAARPRRRARSPARISGQPDGGRGRRALAEQGGAVDHGEPRDQVGNGEGSCGDRREQRE